MKRRIVAILLTAAMVLTISGCGGNTAQKDNRMTTEALSTESQTIVDIDEPRTDIDSDVDVNDTTTEEPDTENTIDENVTGTSNGNSGVNNGDGTWTYTVYDDIVVTLPLCIDDYIIDTEIGIKGLKLQKIAEEHGWVIEDGEQRYHYDAGDHYIYFDFYYYTDREHTVGYLDDKTCQIRTCDYKFTPPEDYMGFYYDPDSTDPREKDVSISYAFMPESLEMILLPSCNVSISRDDAILILYLITFVDKNTKENPFSYLGGSIEDYQYGSIMTPHYKFYK